MTFGEEVYLAMVIGAFCLFAGALAGASFVEGRWAKTIDRD